MPNLNRGQTPGNSWQEMRSVIPMSTLVTGPDATLSARNRQTMLFPLVCTPKRRYHAGL